MLFKMKRRKKESNNKLRKKYGFELVRYYTQKPMEKILTRERFWGELALRFMNIQIL